MDNKYINFSSAYLQKVSIIRLLLITAKRCISCKLRYKIEIKKKTEELYAILLSREYLRVWNYIREIRAHFYG